MAKGLGPNYIGHRQGETRDRFKRLASLNPSLTGPQIATELGVSRARIRELARKEGITLALGKAGRPKRATQEVV